MKIAHKLFPDETGYLASISTKDVECPYCGAELEVEYDDHEGWPLSEECFDTHVICPACEREFELACRLDFIYEAKLLTEGAWYD